MLWSVVVSRPPHTTHALHSAADVILSRAGNIASSAQTTGIVASERSSSSRSGTCSTSAPPTSLATLSARCGVPTATEPTSLRQRSGATAASAARNAARTASIRPSRHPGALAQNPESRIQIQNPKCKPPSLPGLSVQPPFLGFISLVFAHELR